VESYIRYLEEKVKFLEDSLDFLNSRCKIFQAVACFPCFPDWVDLKAREFEVKLRGINDATNK
jgi:hypothetical protein